MTVIDLNAAVLARTLRVDPPRNEPKVRIRIVSRTDGHVVCGHAVPFGESELEVYASQVREFEAWVETDLALVERAAAAAEEHAKAIAETGQNDRPFLPSLEAWFRHLQPNHPRDVRPFRSVSVVEEGAPARPAKTAAR